MHFTVTDRLTATMNAGQQAAFDAIATGRKNIFLTGPAGTGKSFVINEVKKWAINLNLKFTVTALTGCAAVLIGGRTLHSTLGLGVGDRPIEQIIYKLKRCNKVLYQKLLTLDLLVIDEVSMMSDDLLEKASETLSAIRSNPAPFGGVQVVLSGDFCQLGPVTGKFCFHSPLWTRVIDDVCNLTEVVRQSNDRIFAKILQYIRKGKCTKKMLDKLLACANTEFPESIKPTRLYARRAAVEKINMDEYKKLVDAGAREGIYTTRASTSTTNGGESMVWATQVGLPQEVKLCVGAQVVFTANVDQESGIINGTRGVVVDVGLDPKVQLLNGSICTVKPRKIKDDTETLEVEYIPLQYAWAVTIHKSQGMTLDAAEIDLGNSIFAHGQAYTALSRVRNLKSVRILKVDPSSFKVDKNVKKFYDL